MRELTLHTGILRCASVDHEQALKDALIYHTAGLDGIWLTIGWCVDLEFSLRERRDYAEERFVAGNSGPVVATA